ncbi:MAG: IS200/IS605 family element transposase accessory protein TnpB [Actinobacteria bacterium]|nr:IS200/IS605 family element transposase accessory protein TnpB [Actinomycetota bacterium]MBI3686686.1 IS200/IS605 family element transposase accessory protein TnpB [Actinomycetota bacterium]
MTLLAYRFALDPTPRQERALRSHAGAARVTFNTGLDQLARALKNWGDSRNGKRKGKPVGFPRFRSRRKARPSIRFTTGAFRCEARHAVLPRVGRVKLHEDGVRLALLVEAGSARVLAVSVRFERGRWFAAFTVDASMARTAAAEADAVVGVDLGIKTLAVLSTGEDVANPRHLSKALRKVRRLSRTVSRRQGPDRRTRQQPSNRWRDASAALGKAQGRVADQRKDGLHKLTTRLASEFGAIVVEDLHVRGMLTNWRLARHVADASFAEFRRQVEYKSAWRGGRVIVADRWFASSKTCSGCGAAKAKLALSERTYVCASCGMVADRDLNAARNLAALGRRVLAGSGPDSNGRGADRQTPSGVRVAVKRQPGTRQRGQTGTVPTQDGTAT